MESFKISEGYQKMLALDACCVMKENGSSDPNLEPTADALFDYVTNLETPDTVEEGKEVSKKLKDFIYDVLAYIDADVENYKLSKKGFNASALELEALLTSNLADFKRFLKDKKGERK
jgi:hypothetical protein